MKHQAAAAVFGERTDLVAQQLFDDGVVDAGARERNYRAPVRGQIEIAEAGEADRRAALATVEQRRNRAVGECPGVKGFNAQGHLSARR
jgi:hypothetical protein